MDATMGLTHTDKVVTKENNCILNVMGFKTIGNMKNHFVETYKQVLCAYTTNHDQNKVLDKIALIYIK